ncbi:uncharacterized protein QC763_0044480 [Podospora pseudopauciseta]|uniref:Uncharacterized protein n=2 Tax=Podospora TaxID=5144 RepID=A0ABR0HR85_9PEZI|nr:hypothetical protein QC763_0044480 [Podospora pseudopauciseta]KAK4680452.1 hypothetical protein QC764_0045160 [Podospora pseudoanserina]
MSAILTVLFSKRLLMYLFKCDSDYSPELTYFAVPVILSTTCYSTIPIKEPCVKKTCPSL